jgi:hypothetical protein
MSTLSQLVDEITKANPDDPIFEIQRYTLEKLDEIEVELTSIIWTRKVLTDDEIKALPTTPIQLADTPGEDAVQVMIACLVGPLTGTAYTNIDPGAICKVVYGLDPTEDASHDGSIGSNLLGGSPRYSLELGSQAAYVGGVIRTDAAIGQPLCFFLDNAIGDFTGGDPGNQLPVTLAYTSSKFDF